MHGLGLVVGWLAVARAQTPAAATEVPVVRPPTGEAPADGEPLYELSFAPETSLLDLVGFFGPIGGVNFVIADPESLRRVTVTILAPRPVTRDVAWKTFLSALESRGYRLERTGATAKLVKASEGLPEVRPTLRTGE